MSKNKNTAASTANDTGAKTPEQELAEAQARVNALKQQVKNSRTAGETALKNDAAGIMAKYGMSASEFHSAWGRVNGLFANRGGSKNRKLSNEKRDEMIEVLKVGDKTAKEIGDQFGVSAATVNNVKREAGLTKARS